MCLKYKVMIVHKLKYRHYINKTVSAWSVSPFTPFFMCVFNFFRGYGHVDSVTLVCEGSESVFGKSGKAKK